MFDVGGQQRLRTLWKHYYQNSDAVIFVVDSADNVRMTCGKEEYCSTGCARCELHQMMKDEQLSRAVLLVFANKQDLNEALAPAEIQEKLELSKIRNKWFIQPCCAITGSGLYEGLDYLVTSLS
ncbi:hypothetical protein GEMRC1_001557 [Eukaryota sp. GEM-RC1]